MKKGKIDMYYRFKIYGTMYYAFAHFLDTIGYLLKGLDIR